MTGRAVKILVELAVGASPSQVSLAEANTIAALAQDVGVSAIRLTDAAAGRRAVDPSVVAAYLAGRHPGIGWVIDVPTTRNAPYNLARRILSFDRATGGRAGLVLRIGDGDEVSDAAVPDRDASDPAERWVEYATILTRLWDSFPAEALIGDQERAVVADDALIEPIDFDGRFYRVAGPLDGPSSVQGRPVLVAADPGAVGWARIAATADVVIVDADKTPIASAELESVERRREMALLARTDDVTQLQNLHTAGADGVILALGGNAAVIVEALRALPPQDPHGSRSTLRAELGLPVPERAFA